MSKVYNTAGVMPDDALPSVPGGTNLAVLGPSMSGKADLALEFLTAGYEDGGGFLCITTKTSVPRLLDTFQDHVPELDRDRIGVIDCSSSGGSDDDRVMTERVSSPSDLTGISIAMAKLYKRFERRGITDVRYGLLSVSTLLQYLDVDRVFKFLHIYTRRINDVGGFGVYTLDDDAHEPRVVNTISGQFDAVVQLRETDTGVFEFRIRGLGRRPTSWQPLD